MVIFQYNLYIFGIHLWTVLYPKLCYNKPCYNEVVVYLNGCFVPLVIFHLIMYLLWFCHKSEQMLVVAMCISPCWWCRLLPLVDGIFAHLLCAVLPLKAPIKTLAESIIFFIIWVLEKTRFDILYKLSDRQIIHMKCQALFTEFYF